MQLSESQQKLQKIQNRINTLEFSLELGCITEAELDELIELQDEEPKLKQEISEMSKLDPEFIYHKNILDTIMSKIDKIQSL